MPELPLRFLHCFFAQREKPQEYAQKPERNCLFVNSASVLAVLYTCYFSLTICIHIVHKVCTSCILCRIYCCTCFYTCYLSFTKEGKVFQATFDRKSINAFLTILPYTITLPSNHALYMFWFLQFYRAFHVYYILLAYQLPTDSLTGKGRVIFFCIGADTQLCNKPITALLPEILNMAES